MDFGVHNINYFWFGYVNSAMDVCSDGHYGYCSLVIHKGVSEGQYPLIRSALAKELHVNRQMWQSIQELTRYPGSWDDLMVQINYMKTPCGKNYWLDMPFMGLMLAIEYNVIVVILSQYPLLCIPIRSSGPSLAPPSQISTIAHVGDHNQWIPVTLHYHPSRMRSKDISIEESCGGKECML